MQLAMKVSTKVIYIAIWFIATYACNYIYKLYLILSFANINYKNNKWQHVNNLRRMGKNFGKFVGKFLNTIGLALHLKSIYIPLFHTCKHDHKYYVRG